MRKYALVLSFIAILSPVLAGAADKHKAQPQAAPELKFQAVLNRVDKKVIALMGEEKQKDLLRLAQAAVLSDFCAAINLDQEKFKEEFDALAAQRSGAKQVEQRQFENGLMTYFGVYVGLLVAEGTDRRAEFCGLAEDALRDQKPISKFWIATTAREAPKQ